MKNIYIIKYILTIDNRKNNKNYLKKWLLYYYFLFQIK